MELSNYEIVRYPSGQLVITRLVTTPGGALSTGPRDVVGAYTSEQEARSALDRLAGSAPPDAASPAPGGFSG